MKLLDIITESLENKLFALSNRMRKGMTLGAFSNVMASYGIKVEYSYKKGSLPPGEAECTSATYNGIENKIRMNMHGGDDKMQVNKVINDIDQFVPVFQHEMAHFYQAQGDNEMGIEKRENYKHPSVVSKVEYYLQAQERPAMLMNVSAELNDNDISPSELFTLVSELKAWGIEEFSSMLGRYRLLNVHPEDHTEKQQEMYKSLSERMRGKIDVELGSSFEMFREPSATGAILSSYLMARCEAKLTMGDANTIARVDNQFNTFKRLVLKKFKSVTAHHNTSKKYIPNQEDAG